MTAVSITPVLERIARVLAAQRASANADGDESSASDIVDESWPAYQDDALAVLRTLREPDHDMATVGDAAIWERMIAAAIGSPIDEPEPHQIPEPGADPFIEGP